MARLPKDQVPPLGWHFPEGNVIIKDETFDKTVLSIVAHRINNGKPLGHPAEELEEYTLNRINK